MASLQFCSECNNLLYPKADPHRRIMVFACRICQYEEASESKCVYRNDLLTVTKEQVGVTTDLGSDPTLACFLSIDGEIYLNMTSRLTRM
ncbi:putative DNA-directed RNA polymerase II 15.1 kDa polypeptide [Lentinula detonsa]|uniref:DNA-directed RNA polymerase II 15.1 kDa polypeptide n=1 Tax=Lentinula detonsa TaxID=2804962 RepID=A0AA38UQ02_9AGAR|nr:putative DNA-directed RNA polymerase II 15.1 kDa polypeptide [Lentinula detonsa]